jgi:AcrR family transcriptional regulator
VSLETWELLSYVVTVVGLPFAIAVYFLDQRKERENEEEAIWQQLSDAYIDFLEVVLANSDLKLRSHEPTPDLSDEQRERMWVVFDMLISLFERAYLLAYEPDMSAKQDRRWHSWEDYMREWCQREDFRVCLPELLRGEDPDFAHYILRLVQEESSATRSPG